MPGIISTFVLWIQAQPTFKESKAEKNHIDNIGSSPQSAGQSLDRSIRVTGALVKNANSGAPILTC